MNTEQLSTDTNTRTETIESARPAKARRSSRLRSMVLAALLAIGLVGGLGIADASPASAATAVTGCFRWSNGTAYANQPVRLYTYNSSTGKLVSLVKSGRTNSAGCGTFFNTNSTQKLRMAAVFSTDFQYWEGLSPMYAPAGQGTVNVGTGTVYRYW